MEFGLFRTKSAIETVCMEFGNREVRNREVSVLSVLYGGTRLYGIWNLVSFGPSGLYAIERCPYYRGIWSLSELTVYGIWSLSDHVDCP